jgi:predicted Zn finger-like uncharacterized protein
MIVECSQCQTKFKISDEKIVPQGVKVRCSKCKHMFVVKPGGVEAMAEKANNEAGIPDDIFKVPTRVDPQSPETPSAGSRFPLPPPAMPFGPGPSLADKIDLDSGESSSVPAQLPERPSLEEMPARPPSQAPTLVPSTVFPSHEAPPVTVSPPAGASKSNLGDSLFGDLSLASEGQQPQAEPAEKKPPAPPLSHSPSAASQTDDDPFAGIDVSAPSPLPEPLPKAEKPAPWTAPVGPPSSDPVSGEAAGRPTKDLFDDLADPLAGMSSTEAGEKPPSEGDLLPSRGSDLPAKLASEPPPAPPGRPQDDVFASPQSPAGADNPFDGIDTSVPTDKPAARGADSMAGGDPFSQLDSFASMDAPGAEDSAGPSGLELDPDGRLTGEPLPEPPPPTKTAPVQAPQPAPVRAPPPVAAAPTPMAASVPRKAPSGMLWAYKVGFGLLALMIVLLLFVAYRSGGKPDLASWSTYVRAFTGEAGSEEVAGDLEAVGVKNTAYRTRSGYPLLVVWGRVSNKTKAQKSAVVVSGQLLDEKGEELGKFTAPVGVTFTEREVFDMTDHLAVASAYHSRLEQVLDLDVPPEGDVPFMLVFYDHPKEMEGIRIRVLSKESEDPLRGLPPDTRPTEGQEGASAQEDQPGTKPSRKKPPASSAGVGVKKKGTIVRLKPKQGE